jgi:DNA-binding response OmpR family regulator
MKKRIIVVDDDPGVQDVFKLMFAKAGYETIILGGGNDIFENDYALPDLFLIDRQLSGVDGLDICSYLKGRKETQHIPVIITSASPNVAKLAQLAGADEFVEKPFNTKELLNLVEGYMRGNGRIRKAAK